MKIYFFPIIGGGMAKLGPNKKAIEKARVDGDDADNSVGEEEKS